MGDTLVFTPTTPFGAQNSNQYPASLALTNNALLEEIATTIPLLCLGLLGFAVATCLFVTQRLTLPASSVIGAIVFAFIAALLDFSQVLLHSNGTTTSRTLSGFFVAQEVFLVIALVFTLFFYLTYLGRPPYGELDVVPQNKRREARRNSPAAWGASGFLGSFTYVLLAGAIFAVAILHIMWRLVVNPANGVYRAAGIMEVFLAVAFLVKLLLNVRASPLTPGWKTFRNYAPVTISIFINLTIGILNLIMFEFSESSLGRFLQAIQLYILATFMLITPFYGLKRSVEPSDISPEELSFQGLKPRNSISTAYRVSARTIPPVVPTVTDPPQRSTTPRRSTPERITTWFQRNMSPGRVDSLQTRLWRAEGSERDVETTTPSPNAIPTADDSPLDAKFAGEPITVKWLDPAYNTPHDERNLSMTVNPRSSQEVTLPTKTRTGSILLSGRKSRIPPSPVGPPPRPLPAIPMAAPAATRPIDSFGPYKLEALKASVRSSRTPMPDYPPPRRPFSDGYPLNLNSVRRNTTVPPRALPMPPLSRPNVEEDAPVRPATWATQDAFAQIDAVLRDGLQTPLIVEQRSSSGSSKRYSYDSGLARLKKEQEELERSIAELNMLPSSQNALYFSRQQDFTVASASGPMPMLSVPPGRRGSGNGDGEPSFIHEAISSSGVSSIAAFVPKSGSYKSEFSLSNFPSPPVLTFRMSGYDPNTAERNSITAANASTSSDTPSSGSQGTVTTALLVRKKRPMMVPELSKEGAERPIVGNLQTPAGEETGFWDLKFLKRTPEGRVGEGLVGVPSTFRASRISLTGSDRQVSRIVSSYRVSSDSAAVGQGALKDGRQLDVTSFIGELVPPEGDIAPPRRPWLSKPSVRLSTDSQELSAAEIIKAQSTTFTPAVRVVASQAVFFPPSAPTTQQLGIQPSRPTSRSPLPLVVQKTGTGPPSDITPARSSRLKLPPLPIGPLPSTNRLPQNRPRRGAMVAPQTGEPLSRQVSNPSTGGTSTTLQGQQSTPVTRASTISSMPGSTRAASKDKDKGKDTLPDLPAPVGIARILAEMTDEVENSDRVQEKKPDTRKLRTPPFPAKRSGAATRPQRF